MSKKAPKLRRNKKADEIERAAEEITDSYYMLVILGEAFSDTSGNQIFEDIARHDAYKDRKLTTKELMKPSLSEQDDETFFGFWGSAWNRFQDEALNPTMRFIKRWRLVLYDDEDERYKEEKEKTKKKEKNARLEFENKVPKYSKRFFLVTTNFDNDPHESAFEAREYYEKKGTMKEWQCSRKCLGKKTKVFRPDEDENLQFGDFRFEINQQTMLAPAIKYVQRNHMDALSVDQIEPPKNSSAQFHILGDNQDWNFKHPHGYFDFDAHPSGIKSGENAFVNRPITRSLSDTRGMQFRYFMPSLAPLVDSSTATSGLVSSSHLGSIQSNNLVNNFKIVKDPTTISSYYRPGQRESFHSVYDQSGVLRHFNSESLYSDQVGSRNSSRLVHEFSFIRPEFEEQFFEAEKTRIIQEFREEQANIINKYSAPSLDEDEEEDVKKQRLADQKEALKQAELIKENRLQELKQKESNQELNRIQAYHNTLHESVFSNGIVDFQEKGIMSINVVDPLLHHHRYLTEIVDTTELKKNKVLSGSDFEFVISLKIRNKSSGNVPINYFFGPLKPQIRKKSDIDNTYLDSFIIDIHEYSPDHARNVIPFEGDVSLVVECLQGKKLFSTSSGHAGRVCPPELRPWHLYGEYTTKMYKRNKQQEIFGVQRSKHMVDYELVDKHNKHKLIIRTVQYENTKSEIVNVFIELPITSFKKDPLFDPTQPNNFHKPEKVVELSEGMPFPTTQVPIVSHRPIKEGKEDLDEVQKIKNEKLPLPPQHDPTLKPVVNRFLCADCGALARPRIKMAVVDKKWVKTSISFYSKFTKAIVKDLSENGERSLCILELGAGKATQKIADKLIKQTKQYKSSLVRIHPNPPKAKKKVDAEVAEKTITIQQPVGSALKSINDWVEEQAATLDLYFK